MRNKRAVGPVVATVLLILLVTVIISMIFVWGRSFIENSRDETEASQACEAVNLTIGNVCKNVDSDLAGVNFYVKNNRGDSAVRGFLVLVDYSGNSVSVSTNFDEEIGSYSLNEIESDLFDYSDEIVGIEIIPEIEIGNILFDCGDESTEFDWSEINVC